MYIINILISNDKSDFAFTAPLGFEHPMARAHVKLLGPCFKTGDKNEFCYLRDIKKGININQ